MDMQRSRAAQQSECGDKPDKPEAMVAMQMRNEDMVEPREAELCPPELCLRTFTAVYHIELVTQVDDLRRGIMACGGQCRPAAENVDIELFHCFSGVKGPGVQTIV